MSPPIYLTKRFGIVRPWEVYEAYWWMGHYGSLTMKRRIGWSNAGAVGCLDLGVMAKEYQNKHFKHHAKSARLYKKRSGRTGYHGTRFLKGTQILGKGL